MTYIKLHGVSFGYAPERLVLKTIHLTLQRGIYAIAGPNGAGKTTLLKLIAGEILPSAGELVVSPTALGTSLDHSLPAEAHGRLSSGEQKMRQLKSALQQSSEILLLDEPETHLDAAHRRWLTRHLVSRRQLVLMVSHDGALLNLATRILHVENQKVRVFDSGYAAYREQLAHEREVAESAANRAQRLAKSERLQLQQNLERQQKRGENAARRAPNAGIPRVALGLMKRNAERTSGKIEARTKERITELEANIKNTRTLISHQLDLRFQGAWQKPHSGHARLEVVDLQLYLERGRPLWRKPLSFSATGGDRIRLNGYNGAGKSLLIRHLRGGRELAGSGTVACSKHESMLLRAETEVSPEPRSLLQLAHEKLPDFSEGELRRLLGSYGYRGERVFDRQANLSAGERIRLQILLATAGKITPGFCFFDEAEVGLDFESRLAVADFLRRFTGIVVFATHDDLFARRIEATLEVTLERS